MFHVANKKIQHACMKHPVFFFFWGGGGKGGI